MGRRRQATRQPGHGKPKNFDRGDGRQSGPNYDLTMRDNKLFIKYYQGQGFVPEAEWDAFYDTLKQTLPVTFRITGYKRESRELLNHIKGNFFNKMLDVTVDGEPVAPPKCIPWYPNELAWQVDLSRKVVRSSEQLSSLHDFLVAETECGALSRQEVVSMIPPLVLDVKSHHAILDMCASPGSKTAQLIEYLHTDTPQGEVPTGYVMANDTDNKRCYLMVHQVNRLESPCCMIVNHDGTIFPKIQINDSETKPEFQMFDRVLCDVPCSGDGTMRKNFDVWSKWHPLQGANMHGLQTKILKRGCQLLKKGGRLVYSTCSLNPAEDEAVIAEMLRMSQGALELVDISDMLPGLKYTKGLSTWKVMTKTGEWIASHAEVPPHMVTQYKRTIFPPSPAEVANYNLDRCIRVLPHQQDTGGFFVAALRKVHHLPGSKEARDDLEAEKRAKAADNASNSGKEEMASEKCGADSSNTTSGQSEQGQATGGQAVPWGTGAIVDVVGKPPSTAGEKRKQELPVGEEPRGKKQKLHGYKEDPFLFMEESNPIWPQIRDFYGFVADFPVNQLMYRSEKGIRTVYFVSKAIQNIARCNEGRLRIINTGVKAFSRSPSPVVPECDYRVSPQCLEVILPRVSKRIVKVTKSDSVTIISEENPFINKLSSPTKAELNAMSPGSVIFLFTPSESDPIPNCQVAFCGWRGKTSVRNFSPRMNRSHQLMLFGENLKEINKKVEEKKALKAAEEAKMKETMDKDKEDKEDNGGDEDDGKKQELKAEIDEGKETGNGVDAPDNNDNAQEKVSDKVSTAENKVSEDVESKRKNVDVNGGDSE